MAKSKNKKKLEKILFSYEGEQSAFYRIKQVSKYIEKLGYKTRVTKGITKSDIQWSDLVVSQISWMQSIPDEVHRHNKKCIIDLDDVIDSENGTTDYCLDKGAFDLLEHDLKTADAVTVTTEFIKNRYNFNKNTYILENCLDPEMWNIKNYDSPSMNIGWAGGATHEHDLRPIQGTLQQLSKRMNIVFLGYKPSNFPGRLYHKVREYHLYTRRLASLGFKIGIAPTIDIPLNKGKSNLKYLEYSWLGIPSVCSEITYSDCPHTLLYKTPEEFDGQLKRLVEDKELQKELGEKAKQYVHDNYDISRNIYRWENLYKDIYEK